MEPKKDCGMDCFANCLREERNLPAGRRSEATTRSMPRLSLRGACDEAIQKMETAVWTASSFRFAPFLAETNFCEAKIRL